MLKIPAKYKRCGIKIKCIYCKWSLPGAGICHDTGKSLSSCQHKSAHKFQLIVCIPSTKGGRRTKVLDTTSFDTALVEMQKFRQELQILGYHKNKLVKNTVMDTTLLSFATLYLDAISGVNTPQILIRPRSSEHIGDTKRVIKHFCLALKARGYNIDILEMNEVGDNEVGVFYEYLKEELHLGNRTLNKYMGVMKTFFNYIIRVKDFRELNNPFNHLEMRIESRGDITTITKEEFESLIRVITPENGRGKVPGKSRYYYHEWLPAAYTLALLTGLRREELLRLSWQDIQELQNGVLVIRVMNLKVNRIATGDGNGKSVKHVPVTKELMNILIGLGYSDKKGKAGYIIDRPEGLDITYLKNILSRSFAHYIRLATNRHLEYKVLRSTYITHLTAALGPNVKLFSGHTNDQVLKAHYLSSAFLAGNLTDFKMFY